MSSISILVVDDVPAIAEGFAGKFRRYSGEHLRVTVIVEVLHSSDDAVRRISDANLPKLDLLFTDIDLNGGNIPDKAGVAFARFARTKIPGIPLVGCSARFDQDDLSEKDRGTFDKWWPKSGLDLELIAKDTLDRAVSYHKKCWKQPPATAEQSNGDSELYMPKTNDEFLANDYEKIVIEPNDKNNLVAPFAVWLKESPEEGCELEVVGCGAIFSWGDTYDDAEAGLMEVIADIRASLHEPDESFSASLLQAKRFVETVTGSRSASVEA
jgi:CheY-like chemotaxis protein